MDDPIFYEGALRPIRKLKRPTTMSSGQVQLHIQKTKMDVLRTAPDSVVEIAKRCKDCLGIEGLGMLSVLELLMHIGIMINEAYDETGGFSHRGRR